MNNYYDEYLYVDGRWELIGSTDIDLTDYYTKEEADEKFAESSSLSAVATSGDYTDLTNTPSLASVATSGDYDDLLDKPSLATVATSGDYNDLINKPSLSTVATSGSYADLTSKPTNFVGTDGLQDGVSGFVPAPQTSDAGKFLKSDGTWGTVSSGTTDYTQLTNKPKINNVELNSNKTFADLKILEGPVKIGQTTIDNSYLTAGKFYSVDSKNAGDYLPSATTGSYYSYMAVPYNKARSTMFTVSGYVMTNQLFMAWITDAPDSGMAKVYSKGRLAWEYGRITNVTTSLDLPDPSLPNVENYYLLINFYNPSTYPVTVVAESYQFTLYDIFDTEDDITIKSISVNTVAQTPDANKNVDITVPTNNNQLQNGAGYQTASQVTNIAKNIYNERVTYGTADIVPGVADLETGYLYFVYE